MSIVLGLQVPMGQVCVNATKSRVSRLMHLKAGPVQLQFVLRLDEDGCEVSVR